MGLGRREITLFVEREAGAHVTLHEGKPGQQGDLGILGAGALGFALARDGSFTLALTFTTGTGVSARLALTTGGTFAFTFTLSVTAGVALALAFTLRGAFSVAFALTFTFGLVLQDALRLGGLAFALCFGGGDHAGRGQGGDTGQRRDPPGRDEAGTGGFAIGHEGSLLLDLSSLAIIDRHEAVNVRQID